MVQKTHKYGNASRVKCYADGGTVKKNPLPPPEKGGKPKRITTKGKPGDTGPGGANPARNRQKKADGGKVLKKGRKNKPKPEMLGSGLAAKAGEAVRDTRKKQMKDLGI